MGSHRPYQDRADLFSGNMAANLTSDPISLQLLGRQHHQRSQNSIMEDSRRFGSDEESRLTRNLPPHPPPVVIYSQTQFSPARLHSALEITSLEKSLNLQETKIVMQCS